MPNPMLLHTCFNLSYHFYTSTSQSPTRHPAPPFHAPSAALAAPSLPLPAMHPASSLSVTSTEGTSNLPEQQQQQLLHEAASPSPPPPGTRAAVGIIRCQDICCSSRGFVCPAHIPAAGQRGEPQHTLAAAVAPASTRKRPRALLHSVAASPTTSSSVGQPTAAERFAREVSMDAVVFRRVRLGPHHNAEVAYHATVTIGGHVFRGVLYDVGRRSTASTDTAGSSEEESSRSTAGGGGGGLDLTLRL